MSSILKHFVFAEPWWLLLLAAVPLLCFLGYRRGVNHYLTFPTLRVLGTLGSKPKNRTWNFRPLLIPLALIPAILGLARPQWQKHFETRTASGIDIIVALDTSFSMDIRDFVSPQDLVIKPQRRLDAAKEVIAQFIENRPDDRIGIVSFAARPYLASPGTMDHDILIEKLGELVLVNGEEGGTAIGSAISAAATSLEELKDSKSKIIVLVSDGESNSGQLTPLEAAEFSAELGTKIYTIAIGTEDGRLPNGIQVAKQQEFDVKTLQNIAKITKGEFYRALNYSGLKNAFQSIDELEKTEVEKERWTKSRELFHYFVGISIALLLLVLTIHALNPPPLP